MCYNMKEKFTMSHNDGHIYCKFIATQKNFNANPKTNVVTEAKILTNNSDHLSDKVNTYLENTNTRV